jgi:ubiquitin-activating enzyme E1
MGEPMEVDDRKTKGNELDEALYSRQIYVLGKEAMHKMTSCDVLVIGAKGLGIEIAKNVVLAGVRSVTLYDNEPTRIADLGANFFLHQSDIGKPRAAACAKRLAELNNYVQVKAMEGEFTAEAVVGFSVVVVTGQTLSTALSVNAVCHANAIPMVCADCLGICASIFCDFGPSFVVSDSTGEEALSVLVSSIDTNGMVTTHDENRHGFEDGDFITFSEVQGAMELNGCAPLKIEVKGPYAFSIGQEAAAKLSAYTGGGYAHQVKMPKTITHLPLAASLSEPQFLDSDFAKLDRPLQLHALYQAVSKFREVRAALPALWLVNWMEEWMDRAQTACLPCLPGSDRLPAPRMRARPSLRPPALSRPSVPPHTPPPTCSRSRRAGEQGRAAHARRHRAARPPPRPHKGGQRCQQGAC